MHTNLNPREVIITSNGEAKIRHFLGNRSILDLVGGPAAAYASPAVINGEEPSLADDIYSFGLIAYHTITGLQAYGDRPATDAMSNGWRVKKIYSLTKPQWLALENTIALDPNERATSMVEFQRVWVGKGG